MWDFAGVANGTETKLKMSSEAPSEAEGSGVVASSVGRPTVTQDEGPVRWYRLDGHAGRVEAEEVGIPVAGVAVAAIADVVDAVAGPWQWMDGGLACVLGGEADRLVLRSAG